MAKDSISSSESRSLFSLADVFNPISPNTELCRNILHSFWKLGLVPILRREVDGELVDLSGRREDQEDGTDSYLYLPSEVAANIGSDTSTWVRWGTLACDNIHQHLADQGQVGLTREMLLDAHVPNVTLPEETVRALSQRGHRTHRRVKLVSLPVVAFFLAAQYGAWADPEEVATVSPFKNLLHQLGIVVRQCDVRRPSKLLADISPLPGGEVPLAEITRERRDLIERNQSLENVKAFTSQDTVALDNFLKNIKAVAPAPATTFLPVTPPTHRSTSINPVVGEILDSTVHVPFSGPPNGEQNIPGKEFIFDGNNSFCGIVSGKTSPSGAAQDTTLDELSTFTEDDSSMNATTDIDALIREHEAILRELRMKKTIQDLRASVLGAVVEEVYVEGGTPLMRLRRADNSVFDVLVPASMIPVKV